MQLRKAKPYRVYGENKAWKKLTERELELETEAHFNFHLSS
jgi:hypothetical protein